MLQRYEVCMNCMYSSAALACFRATFLLARRVKCSGKHDDADLKSVQSSVGLHRAVRPHLKVERLLAPNSEELSSCSLPVFDRPLQLHCSSLYSSKVTHRHCGLAWLASLLWSSAPVPVRKAQSHSPNWSDSIHVQSVATREAHMRPDASLHV